jgi:probable phosphoglycerate mutase
MQGWAPVTLTDHGREQARTLGPALAEQCEVDRVVASDLERTAETARLLAETGPLPDPEFDDAFRERHVGRYQGLPKHLLRSPDGERPDLPDITPVDYVPDGGESLREMAERVRTGFERLAGESAADDTVVLVTHGGPIRTLLGTVQDQSLATALSVHDPENCSVTAFEAEGGHPTVARRPDLPPSDDAE